MMKIGDRVRCVYPHIAHPEHTKMYNLGVRFPEKDKIYTIRGFNNYQGVYLEEIVNPHTTHTGDEPGFHTDYFEPISHTPLIFN